MTENRRPISSREHPLAQRIAAALAHHRRISPNQISLLSMVFAAIGATLLAFFPNPFTFICAALTAQMRLLCNLFDGMVAVEGGWKTPVGEMFNELPDRVSDSLFYIALGYAAQLPWLGYLAALFAVGTAYIRVFGGSLGLAQSFRGPFAKQQRMAVFTLACLCAAFLAIWDKAVLPLQIAAWLITLGSALTCLLRIRDIALALTRRAAP